MDGKKDIAVSFCGDSAIEEGVFAESINFSLLKKIPVLFVCENNFFSSHTPLYLRQPDTEIFKRIKGMGIEAIRIDGNDVLEVYQKLKSIIFKIRKEQKPFFVECLTYRFKEHVGPSLDLDNPYRSEKELKKWLKKCPVKRLSNLLIEKKIIKDIELTQMISKIKKEVTDAISFAKRSPWPKNKEMLNNVY
jgi:pyruvate dehydrogenase E1 component alpha subunit